MAGLARMIIYLKGLNFDPGIKKFNISKIQVKREDINKLSGP